MVDFTNTTRKPEEQDMDNTAVENMGMFADTSSNLSAQQQRVAEAWNQQDPIKIAQDLNALLQKMMQQTPTE